MEEIQNDIPTEEVEYVDAEEIVNEQISLITTTDDISSEPILVETGEMDDKSNPNAKPEVYILTKEFRKKFGIKLKPFKRKNPKIRRNAKCPCGSGLKYKRCCINKEVEQL